ncbi:MAG: PD-(D/E)XK nuclease family protein [Aggregatilineales bacterium]
MPTTIILAPVGAGKTNVVLDRLTKMLDTAPFAKVWALLASKRQENAFRQRLVEHHTSKPVFFNVEFFNFYQLYQRVLDMKGEPPRDLSDTARYGILRAVIGDLQREGQLHVFSAIAETPGFLRITADFIFELKQNRIFPEDFTTAAALTHRDKDQELALIYESYQQRLQYHQLADIEGQGWLAQRMLEEDAELAGDVQLLIVDGFDQFTPVQADILSLLAGRVGETLITLTTISEREKTVGRRFDRALESLTERLGKNTYEIKPPPADAQGNRHPRLQYLIEQVFRHRIDHSLLPADDGSGDCLRMIEAPSTASEVSAVLRRVKHLLLDGESPEEIMIVLRDWGRYYTHFLSDMPIYGLPLVLHYGQPLAENPAIDALMMLLQLHENDFRRRDLLDVLRSPYFAVPALNEPQINLLEQISQKFAVIGGKEQWLDAIQLAIKPRSDDEDDPTPADSHETLIDAVTAHNLQADLEEFFDWITPADSATVEDYIGWLEMLIGYDPEIELDYEGDLEIEMGGYTLDMIARMRDKHAPPEIIARDLTAMQEFKRVLRGLLAARELLTSLEGGDEPEFAWADFASDLQTAVNAASVNARPNRSGQVLVTTAADARGLPHEHVFVVGLSEGIFPARIPEDPLYLDSERRKLKAYGITLLEQSERAADDGVFYELLCLPRRTLTLSRPTVDDGKPWIESHFWRAVNAVFPLETNAITWERLPVGKVVLPEEAASWDEVALAVADQLASPADELTANGRGVYNWLAGSSYWAQIDSGRAIDAGRLGRASHNRYSGVLENDALIYEAAQAFRPDVKWSASRLNDYGVCGFKFFAKRLLKLEPLDEPEIGLDHLQRGSLNHKILELTYEQVGEHGMTITEENQAEALTILESVAGQVFSTAPDDFGFRVDGSWEIEQQIILRRLHALVTADFSAKNPIDKAFGTRERIPHQQEAFFGNDEDFIDVPLENGDTLRLLGFIDRIDREGERVVIIDYKGSTTIALSEMEEGRNVQMMVYMLAAEQLFTRQGLTVAGGAFWHLNNRGLSGTIKMDDAGRESIRQAQAHIVEYLERGRQGDFAVHANKPDKGKCIHHCDYSHLCRMSMTNRYKPD